MAGRAGHEKKNDALGLGGKMRLLRRERIREGERRCPAALAKQTAEGNRAEANAALLEKPAPRDELSIQAAIEM